MSVEQQTLMQEVKQVASERVAPNDYEHQIERWNKYQNVIDKVQNKVRYRDGVIKFDRGVKTNVNNRTWDDMPDWLGYELFIGSILFAIAGLLGWGMLAYPIMETHSIQEFTADGNIIVHERWEQKNMIHERNAWILVGLALGQIGFIAYQVILRSTELLIPKTLKFTCSPKIHINELTYARSKIQGIPQMKKDPIIRLPVVTMKIPRKWIAQRAILETMDGLGDIDIDFLK